LAKLTFFGAKVTMQRSHRMTEIAILAYPDCQLAAVLGLTDLFLEASRISRELGGAASPLHVTQWRIAADGRTLECQPDSHAGNPPRPGSRLAPRLAAIVAPPTLKGPPQPEAIRPFVKWLRERHAAGATICSACGGTFLLADAGLLRGRRATTHWNLAEELARRYPEIQVDADKQVIDDGDIVTAGGIMAWTDLGIRLTERFLGPAVMLATAHYFLVDPAGREQRFYRCFSPRLDHGDEAVVKVQHWLQKKGLRDVGLAAMAAQAGLEQRTFLRHFRKATGLNPTEYCQQLRVAKARELLELTNRTVDQVAWAVGYADPGSFRKVFQKVTGLRPAEYRKRFRATAIAGRQGRK
jgi:transcriptional regulator GlxA family with amidase domain